MQTSHLQSSIGEDEFLLFRGYIENNCGICIPPEKAYLIETRLSKLMLDAGAESFGEFYKILTSSSDLQMKQKVIDSITTNETLWFRDADPWNYMEAVLLPRLVGDLASGRKRRVRIWSAAAATGPEIYSTAICVDNYLQNNRTPGVCLSDFEFFATDISSRALEIAKKGRYDRISIKRGLSEHYKTKYFVQNESAWDIDPKIRDAVRFANFNLQNSFTGFGLFDIVFCRYVLIYFADDLKKEIITKMEGALTDGGVLFTGNYVLYEFFKDIFDVGHYGNTTYFSKKAVIL
jgi:chemotaxis protein methyltransferase CheR